MRQVARAAAALSCAVLAVQAPPVARASPRVEPAASDGTGHIQLAAAFVPGQAPAEASRPAPASPAAAPQSGPADGFAWEVAPIRSWGVAAAEARRQKFGNGSSAGELVTATVNASSYIWQPWFLRVEGSLGAVASVTRADEAGKSTSVGALGSLNLGLFPASRFPFTFYADLSDSRATGEITALDYRSLRIRASQSYSPPRGNDRYSLTFEQSTIDLLSSQGSDDTSAPSDTVQVLRMTASNIWQTQSLAADVALSRNRHEDGDSWRRSSVDQATLLHTYAPRRGLNASSQATVSRSSLRMPQLGGTESQSDSDFAQAISFITFQPDSLQGDGRTFLGTGNVRVFDAGVGSNGREAGVRGLSAALGMSLGFGPTIQLTSSTQAGFQTSRSSAAEDQSRAEASQVLGVTYSMLPIPVAGMSYQLVFDVSGAAGVELDSEDDEGFLRGSTLFQHSLTRTVQTGQGSALTLALSQTLSYRAQTNRGSEPGIVHTLSGNWNAGGGSALQSYVGVSFSDARFYGDLPGTFQIGNLQANLQLAPSRWSVMSGSVSIQVTRDQLSGSEFPDLGIIERDDSWRTSYALSLNYSHARVFGIRGLAYMALAQGNSFEFDGRITGNPEADAFRTSWLFDNRLVYRVGRLELSATLRFSQVQDFEPTSLFFLRVQRLFGAV